MTDHTFILWLNQDITVVVAYPKMLEEFNKIFKMTQGNTRNKIYSKKDTHPPLFTSHLKISIDKKSQKKKRTFSIVKPHDWPSDEAHILEILRWLHQNIENYKEIFFSVLKRKKNWGLGLPPTTKIRVIPETSKEVEFTIFLSFENL